MPSFTTVVEDTSPILQYSANWRAGTSADDNSADQYTQSSFTVTQTSGATMTFKFNGTAVGVYGALRPNHGPFSIQLDSTSSPILTGTGNPSSASFFNQSLFASGTPAGLHNLVVINQANTFLDIDYVSFQTAVGQENESLIINTFQDDNPAFTYNPSSSWGAPHSVGSFSGASGHGTNDTSAVMTLNFQLVSPTPNYRVAGDAITLYGPVGPDAASAYSVQLDGGSPVQFSARKQFFRPQQILYFASNLGPGSHLLKMQLVMTGELAIDYANVYITASLGGSFLGSPVSNNPSINSSNPSIGTDAQCSKSSTSPGVIAAIGVTAFIAAIGYISLFYVLWRQNRSRRVNITTNDRNTSNVVQPFSLSGSSDSRGAPSTGMTDVPRQRYPITIPARKGVNHGPPPTSDYSVGGASNYTSSEAPVSPNNVAATTATSSIQMASSSARRTSTSTWGNNVSPPQYEM